MSIARIGQDIATLGVTCFTFQSFPVVVVGNTPQLGNWDPERGLALQFSGSVKGREQWRGTIELEPGQAIEFKFVHKTPDGPDWEVGPNRTYTADSDSGYLETYFRTENETWLRLLAGDRAPDGGSLTARGDIVRALEILLFLSHSNSGVRSASLADISPKAADTIREAVATDGHNADMDITGLSVLMMTSGRTSRNIVFAHVPTSDFDESSIDYLVEEGILVGRLFRNPIGW